MAIPNTNFLAVATGSGTSTTPTGTKPTGTLEANVLIATLAYVNTTTISASPAGWVQIGAEVDAGAAAQKFLGTPTTQTKF